MPALPGVRRLRACGPGPAQVVYCPFCSHAETKVTDSRLAGGGTQIRRRRECLACGERYTTFETAELVMPLLRADSPTP